MKSNIIIVLWFHLLRIDLHSQTLLFLPFSSSLSLHQQYADLSGYCSIQLLLPSHCELWGLIIIPRHHRVSAVHSCGDRPADSIRFNLIILNVQHFRPSNDIYGFTSGRMCLLFVVCSNMLLSNKRLKSDINIEAGRQATCHRLYFGACVCVCVCVSHLIWEGIQGDRRSSHGTNWGCFNNNSGNDCTLAHSTHTHTHTKWHTQTAHWSEKKITQMLFLHSDTICCSSHFCFVAVSFLNMHKGGSDKNLTVIPSGATNITMALELWERFTGRNWVLEICYYVWIYIYA